MDEIDDVWDYSSQTRIFFAHLVEQRNLVLCDERDTIKVVPELVDLPQRTCQCRFVRKGESCGHAIKLSERTVLHLPICLDLLLQANDLVRPLISFAQRKEAD
jgi:hypothetical protein